MQEGIVRRILTATAVSAVVLSVAACGGGDDGGDGASTQYADGKTLTMVVGADPGSLDPHFASLSATQQIDYFLYDSLIGVASDGSLVPGLATDWEGTTTRATYTLRKGITCSDGTPLTASDVAANISFVGNPKNASSRIGVFVPAGATATGDNATGTVTVESATPDAFLVRNVGALPIVCPRGMKDRSLLKTGADGTGMYTVAEAVPGSHYTLTLRKGYDWGPAGFTSAERGVPATIVLKVVANMTTATNLLLSGQANIATVIGPDEQRLRERRLYSQAVVLPTGQLWFNEKPGMPGSDVTVRRALAEALELDQLRQVVTNGTGKPATGMIAPHLRPCTGDTVGSNLPAHDPAAAKAALDAAGWTVGPGGIRQKNGVKLELALYYPTKLGSGFAAGATLVQQAWKDLGVQVELHGITDREGDTMVFGGQAAWGAAFIPLGIASPGGLVPFVSGPTPPNGTNFAHISNDAYTAAATKAASMPDTAGCEYWNAAETALFKEVNPVPFADSPITTFGSGATFQLSQGFVMPSSVRMLGEG
jgi:peptide/nickel transport system substrate-binding protein